MRSIRRMSMSLAALLIVGGTAQAEVVHLTGGRSLRAVAVTASGTTATVALTSGGSLTLPIRSIDSITPEPVSSDLCDASPYRCQNRSMLLTRHAQASAAAAAVAAQNR
jgi:hypothetical protein